MTKKLMLLLLSGWLSVVNGQAQLPYQDPSLTPDQRAEDLLERLTLEEKVSLMQNNSPAIPRLGIKPYNWWSEALHGVARAGQATVFPQAIGMGASFNDSLLYYVFCAVSDEARAKHRTARLRNSFRQNEGLTFWTPNVNIFRDPRWGRGQETYGEDPCLTARMGTAVVRGLQGPEGTRYDKAHACAKHYAVHSGPEWNRHSFNAEDIAPRDLWETYLPAFKTLVQKARVKEVMCAYNRFEGDPCCGSNRLLNHILRQEWGFQGIVVSDCGAIDDFYHKGHHQTHKDRADASAHAVRTGTDLECGSSYRGLTEAVDKGLIETAEIDRSVKRLLKARFELGEMDGSTPWDSIPETVISSPAHRRLALQMACESMVLLQNRNRLLPLDKDMTVALIGPNANDSVMQWANYNGFPAHTVTLYEALERRLAPGKLIYIPGCGHVTASEDIRPMLSQIEQADVVVFAGGISPTLEGEEMVVDAPGFHGGDRTDIELPAAQRQLIAEIRRTGKPVVFVCFSGSAIALEPEAEACDAILQAWYPGQEGGTAVADVLYGDYNPAGRLPVTFYRNTGQIPDYQDYSMKGRTYRYLDSRPLFAFGHGLSYTTFAYGKASVKDGRLSVRVTNTGERGGDEVVQVYLRRDDDPDGPHRTLRDFRRVYIPAGESRTLEFVLDDEFFSWWNKDTQTMRPSKGKYTIEYGGSSDSRNLRKISYKYSPPRI